MYLIQPFFEENEKILGPSTLEYAATPYLAIDVTKVTNFKGKPPSPRISHSAMMYKDKKKHFYLIIYGGRNDSIFA